MAFQAPEVKPCDTTKEEKRFGLNTLENTFLRE